jgi:metallo-beta-lactamase class B
MVVFQLAISGQGAHRCKADGCLSALAIVRLLILAESSPTILDVSSESTSKAIAALELLEEHRIKRDMRLRQVWLLSILSFIATLSHAATDPGWTTPIPPFQIADNLYYVGSQDLASYLVVTPAGNILINANFATSPPQIRSSIEKLGFHWEDTKILLNSQAHSDHMAGAAEIIRETHAKNMVMDGDVSVVETGARTDFLAPSPNIPNYEPAHADRILHDGDSVSLGDITLHAHKTAGHTRGCTTWTLRAHIQGERAKTIRDVVIVGGVTFWSEYHFLATSNQPVSYPGIVQDFRHTFALLHSLPCDVFLGAHGGYFDMLAKLKQYPKEGPRVFIDHTGYESFISDAQRTFEKAVSEQQAHAGR